jgi:MFS family permease
MWVVGFTLMIDSIDQYIVRGSSNQIEHAFGVGDTAISVLFAAFILVNGVVTLPAGFLADRWNRTRAMAVTILAWSVISALGGIVPTGAFGLLIVIRASLGFGQAVTDPSGSSVIADYYGTERRGAAFSIQQCLTYVGVGVGLAIGGALGPRFGGDGWRAAFFVSILPGLVVAYFCWRLPEPSQGTADRAHVTKSERTWWPGCGRTSAPSCPSPPCATRWSAFPPWASWSPRWPPGCPASTSCNSTSPRRTPRPPSAPWPSWAGFPGP